ncbi:MAG: choice-of-anchor tandem repeat GloVer-containing protein [Terriglobales bacterium]
MRTVFAALGCWLLVVSLAQAQGSSPTISQLFAFYCNSHYTSCPYGVEPALAPLQFANGIIYGVTLLGGQGKNAGGTVWQVSTAGQTSVVHTFKPGAPGKFPNGRNPVINFVEGADHNLYGFTQYGGSTNRGVMYKLLPNGGFQVLHDFCTGTCEDIPGPVIVGQDGNFYGAQSSGAAIFRMTPSGTYSVVLALNPVTQGAAASLIQGKDGNFYGTGALGSSTECDQQGIVFKMTPTGTYSILHTFGTAEFPSAALIQASDGNFYGAVSSTIFRLTPEGGVTTLYTLQGEDGISVLQIQQASDGNLWVLTGDGGPAPTLPGEIFAVNLQGAKIAAAAFDCATTGCGPSGVIQGSDGAFYGVAGLGGFAPNQVPLGSVFKVDAGLPPLMH